MTLFELLETLHVQVSFGRHTDRVTPPYLMLIGAGQDTFSADNTYTWTRDRYTIEYYYKVKNPEFEQTLEKLLLDNGYQYVKSEDLYMNDEKVFFIYYNI